MVVVVWANNVETIDETMRILPQAAPANVAQPYETALARSMYGNAGLDPRLMETCYIPASAPLLDDRASRGVDDDQVHADSAVLWTDVVERHRPARLWRDSLLEEAHLVLVGDEVGRLARDRDGLVGRDVAVRRAATPRHAEGDEQDDEERDEPEDPAVPEVARDLRGQANCRRR